MKLLSLHEFTKIILVVLVTLSSQCLQEKIKTPVLNQKFTINKSPINDFTEKKSSIRSNLGLSCQKHKCCMKTAHDITNNLKKYESKFLKLVLCIFNKIKPNDKILQNIIKKDFNFSLYIHIIKINNINKLQCFVNSYFELHKIFNWILIAKDLKEECLTILEKVHENNDNNKNVFEQKKAELNQLFDIFEYMYSYISFEHKHLSSDKYLYGLYFPKNKNNKILNMNNSVNNEITYLYSPNILRLSDSLLNVLSLLKTKAENSKVILFVIDKSNTYHNGQNLDNIIGGYNYYTKPYSIFEVIKVDINNESKIENNFNDNELLNYLNKNIKNKKLRKNITIIKLKYKSNSKILQENKQNIIFSVLDTIDNKDNN